MNLVKNNTNSTPILMSQKFIKLILLFFLFHCIQINCFTQNPNPSSSLDAAIQSEMDQASTKPNARQLFQRLRKTVEAEQAGIEPPKNAPGKAPTSITVYTDGAMKQPHNQLWGLLGYGVWWVQRDIEIHPITAQEHGHTNGH